LALLDQKWYECVGIHNINNGIFGFAALSIGDCGDHILGLDDIINADEILAGQFAQRLFRSISRENKSRTGQYDGSGNSNGYLFSIHAFFLFGLVLGCVVK
jgi:hypothetical protein